MTESASLSEADVRAVVRLVGDVCAMEGDHAAMKRFLMDGLCRLIDAECWAWGLACEFSADKTPVYIASLNGGFTEARFAKYMEALEHPDIARLNSALTREFEQKKTHLTRRREQIDPENFFPSSDAFRIWSAAGIAEIIMSVRPLGGNTGSALGIYRGSEKPPFTSRESRVAHIVLSEVPWLHELGWPQDRGATVPRLSPRQRITLNLLLQGQSRRRIVEHLAISTHTVDGYVKEVYRHFGVHSQAELIARFQRGDGGDVP